MGGWFSSPTDGEVQAADIEKIVARVKEMLPKRPDLGVVLYADVISRGCKEDGHGYYDGSYCDYYYPVLFASPKFVRLAVAKSTPADGGLKKVEFDLEIDIPTEGMTAQVEAWARGVVDAFGTFNWKKIQQTIKERRYSSLYEPIGKFILATTVVEQLVHHGGESNKLYSSLKAAGLQVVPKEQATKIYQAMREALQAGEVAVLQRSLSVEKENEAQTQKSIARIKAEEERQKNQPQKQRFLDDVANAMIDYAKFEVAEAVAEKVAEKVF
jgi:hypothetical protein